MRAIWIDEGNDANLAKLRSYAIDTPSYSVRDPRVTLAYLQGVRAQGFGVGLYAAWNWLPPPYTGEAKGAAFATYLSQQLARIAPDTAPDFPRVCADIETHDVPYIRGFLRQWRKYRPQRVTDFALEGFQGGLFGSPDVGAFIAARMLMLPACYTGAMEPLDAVASALDLTAHGFPSGMVSMFYDAAHLPAQGSGAAWSGYAFTQGRLP